MVNLAYVNKNIRKQTTIIMANNLFGKRTIYLPGGKRTFGKQTCPNFW